MSNPKGKAAVCGLGITPMGKVYGRTAMDFAAEAIKLALDDAGLRKQDLDGLLVNPGPSQMSGGGGIGLQKYLGIPELRMNLTMQAGGSTAGQMLHVAALAIDAGMASTVACVFADDPLKPGRNAGAAYSRTDRVSLRTAYGQFGAVSDYALAARRHMHLYGTTTRQFGAIAVAQRKWAAMNPRALMREPITLEDHENSRWVVEPLRLLDCCLVCNGGVCVIVTTPERARSLRQPPVYLLGMGQRHYGHTSIEDSHSLERTPAREARDDAFRMAGVKLEDIQVTEIYDCFTYAVLCQIEDLGFCKKGEGGAFVEDGKTGPGGSRPINTGGGSLSSYYMWGMTPISEAIIQARGQGGKRQVGRKPLVMATAQGGQPWTWLTVTVMSQERG
jgi:acetyl-CoA acetyltransferase